MGAIGDFFSTLFHGGKTQADKTAEQNASKTPEKIQGYGNINGETVQVVDNESTGEWLASGIVNLPNTIKTFWNDVIRDPLTSKQSVDEQLLGLKYDGEGVTDDQKNQYIQKLGELQRLNEKPVLTIEEAVQKQWLQNDLDRYTVPDTIQNGDMDNGRFGYDTLISRVFGIDRIRNNAALKDSKAKWVPVDRDKILGLMDDSEGRTWAQFGARDPEGRDGSGSMRVLTKDEFEAEKKRDDVNTAINDLIDTKVKELVSSGFKAPGNPGGRNSTEDEVRGLLESVMQDRAIASNLESYREAYAQFKDSAPEIANEFKKMSVGLVDMATYILKSDKDSKAAYEEYVEANDNPLEFDVDRLDQNKLNGYERTLLYTNLTTLGQEIADYVPTGTSIALSGDGAHIANSLIRWAKTGENLSKGNIVGGAWNALEWAGATIGSAFSSALGHVAGLSTVATNAIKSGELKQSDFDAALFGWQSSSIYNLKQNYQQEWADPDYFGSDIAYVIKQYGSIVDDIGEAHTITKFLDFPVTIAELKNVNKVLVEGKKLEKAVEGAKAVSKGTEAVKVGEEIVKGGEKLSKTIDAGTFFSRAKNGIKSFFSKSPEVKAGEKAVQIGMKDTIMLGGKNIANWIADEAMSSAMFQGMTPYTYSQEDLSMDIFGAVFSGLLRVKTYNNRMGMFKYNAINSVWTEWYLSEVMGYSRSQTIEAMEKMDSKTINTLGGSIKEKFSDVLDKDTYISRSDVKSKSALLGGGVRDATDKFVLETIERSEQNLMRLLADSADIKYTRLVKRLRIRGEDGSYVTKYEWNKPKGMKQSTFDNLKKQARVDAYSPKGLNNSKTIKGKSDMLNRLKVHVHNNLAAMASRGSKNTRALVEKVNGKWRFKKGVSSNVKKALEQEYFKRAANKMGLGVHPILKKGAGKDTWFGFGVQDYTTQNMGQIQQRFALYINSQILGKKLSKRGILHGLSVYGAAMERCFRRRMKETYNVGDIEELSEKEIISAMMEFGKTVDEFIFPDFVRRGEMSNIADPLGNDGQFLANMTYDEAIKLNPDLRYMSPEEFNLISGDKNLSIIQKELKLRGYERIDAVNGKQIYGLNPGSKMGEITFHDTMEEKAMMGDTGEVYIQIDNDGGANVIAKNKDKYPSQIKPINKKSAKKYKYKLEDADKNKPGVRKYSIHDDNNLLIGYIETSPNYHLSNPNASPSLQDLYGSNRTMRITLMQGDLKGKSVELEFERATRGDGSAFIVQKYDQNMKLPSSKRKVTGRYFDTKMGEVPETSLQQWNGLTIWIRDGGKNYNDFCKMIPGYTDRVPQSYFTIVVNDKNLSVGDKMNMLIGAMFNKNITETGEGIRFNVVGGKTFNRKTYRYSAYRRNKSGGWEMSYVVVNGDNEIYYNALSDGGAVLVKADPNGKAEAFYYKPGRNSMQFELYRSLDDKKPAGVISFEGNRLTGYFKDKGGRKQILGDVEFMHNNSKEFVTDALSKRYNETNGTIRVEGGDEMYREIYKELYGQEMQESEYLKIKNTPNMSPEKYLNQIVDEFKQSRFGRYAIFKKGDWKSQINQMNRFKVITGHCDNYLKRYPSTGLNDAMIYKAAEKYVNESLKSNSIIRLTKSEEEIRDIMYGKNARSYDPNSMINIYGYSMFGIEPPKDMFRSEVLQRLRNRREAILLALYKDKSVKSWSDYEQSAFLSRMKRRLGRDIHKRTDVSLEDLIEDIKAHPDEYQAIASKFWEKIKKVEDTKATDDMKDLDELDKLNKRKEEIEQQTGISKPKKVKGPDTDKISHINYEAQQEFLQGRLSSLENQRLELLQSGDVSDEGRVRLADLNRQIDETNNAINSLNENISYIESKNLGEMTEEEYDFLVDKQLRGEGVYEAGRLNKSEVQKRVNQIKKNIPGCRVLDYDPITRRIDDRALTKEERQVFAKTLDTATNALMNGEAKAAHLGQLHAIVIDPTNVSLFDLGHEWFHESCALMMDQSRRYEVFEEAYTKFGDQIEEFARARGYAEQFDNLDELTYQRKITEEWLAERFGEYVQGRLELDNNIILKFFKELWERIKLMFSDTQVMELFDDIYEGRLEYNPVKIDLKPEDIHSPNYKLIKDTTTDYINTPGFAYGDDMNIDELIRAVGYDDAAILTNSNFTGRGNFFSAKKQVITLEDGRQIYANYDELYEGIMRRDKEIGVDNAIRFLYGSDGDFYNWISNRGTAKYKSAIIGGGAMMVEVHYPDNWDGATIADFKIVIPKGAEGAKAFTIEGITNKTIDELSNILSRGQYNNAIIKALQTYSLNAESLKFAEIDPSTYDAHIKAMGSNYDRFINQYMPDVLEKSVDEFQHGVRDASFDNYDNIDIIEAILNRAHRTLMFDWCIPHTNGARNGVVVDIYNGLYNRKWQRTKELIQDVITLGDNHLTYKIGRSRGKCPVIQFIFKDNLGNERVIGWHMTDEQVAEGKGLGFWKYGSVDEMMDTANLHAPGWHKSMLIDPEGTKYKKNGIVGIPMNERVRNARGVKTPISFRRPIQNGMPSNRIYRFDGLAIQTDIGKGFVAQKNMTLSGLEGALKNHGGISSSVAISENFIDQGGSSFGPIALIGRKLGTEGNKVPFEGYKFFTSDTWTPILNDIVTADFQLAIRDIVNKYSDRLENYNRLPKSIKKEINEVIKSYGLELKGNITDDSYRVILDWSSSNNYSQPISNTDTLSKIKGRLRESAIAKDKVVSSLLKDEERLSRIYEEIFEGRLAGMNGGGERPSLLLDNIDQYMLGLKSGRSFRGNRGDAAEELKGGYVYNKDTGLLDFDATYENVKDLPALREQYTKLNIASEAAYKDYIKELIILNDFVYGANQYFEGYSRKLSLNDFHSMVTDHDTANKVEELLKKYNYKYYRINDISGMTHEDFEKLIDEYANQENSFLLIEDGKMETLIDVDEEGQPLSYDEIFTNSRAERDAEREIALINRRTNTAQLSDETLEVLQRYGLTGPVIGISEQKYIDNMKNINNVLRDNNYNMRRDVPELYEQRQSLKKTRIVNDKQTWANSKRRILNKEYRDINNRIRDIERRMEIRQEEFDNFTNSPMYYQASKLREALEQSSEARSAVKRAYENSDVIVPENTQSYKPNDGLYTENKDTVSIMPPLAKRMYKDNYYQITYGNPVSDFLESGDESLMTIKNPYRATEMNIIGGEVDLCLPVGSTSLSDPDIFDNIIGADSFAIWATDTDTLNKFKARVDDEMPDYRNVYDRVDGNIAYYVSDDMTKSSDEVSFRKTRQQQLAKQAEEDKNITEASLGSVLDSSLICNI